MTTSTLEIKVELKKVLEVWGYKLPNHLERQSYKVSLKRKYHNSRERTKRKGTGLDLDKKTDVKDRVDFRNLKRSITKRESRLRFVSRPGLKKRRIHQKV